jgi:DNA-binding NtrC family response regulator
LNALDQILRQAAEKKTLRLENTLMKAQLARKHETGFVFKSRAMRQVEKMIARIAPSDGTVLIIGESGTGKELAAHAVHAASDRADKPFVDVNCGAIPGNLLESELFGNEKGAFTGADTARPGLFEMAHRGTLFLDEIGELPLELQVKLLRVLETKSFYRIGGRHLRETDVRIVAATNRDLSAEIETSRFRKDLYFRINGLSLVLPPLRERPEDIRVLVEHFAAPNEVGDEAMDLLRRYHWPGNVRELKNVIERAKLIGNGGEIVPDDLPNEITTPGLPPKATESGGSARAAAAVPAATPASIVPLKEVEKQQIIAILEQVHWHRGRAAELLGISPKTLYRKLRAYGITG